MNRSADPYQRHRFLPAIIQYKDGPSTGTKDSSTGENGGVISAMPLQVWDFENDT